MRFLARLLAALCLTAFVAGEELQHEPRTRRVPVTAVDPKVCVANGPVLYVTEHPAEPGVYNVTCGDGVVLTAGTR